MPPPAFSLSAAFAPGLGVLGGWPAAWVAVLASGCVAWGVGQQIGWRLTRRRQDALLDAVRREMGSANYQESWRLCAARPGTEFGAILRPALEKIGEGGDAAAAALVAAVVARRRLGWRWLAALGVAGVVVPAGAVVFAGVVFAGATNPASSALWPREVGALEGAFFLLVAAAFAVAVGSLSAVWNLSARGAAALAEGEAEGRRLLEAVPYEDVAGVRVGREFDAGKIATEDDADAGSSGDGRLRVSRTLTTACPECNAVINPSHRACPRCGLRLEWA